MGARVLVIGGTSHSLVNFRRSLLQEMSERGHEVIACAPPDRHSSQVRRRLNEDGIEFEVAPIERRGLNPLHDFRSVGSLTGLMRRLHPDRVLAYMIKPVVYGGMAAERAGDLPFFAMITGLGYPFAETGDVRQRVLNRVVRALYRRGLRSARCVIFQNPDDQALFRSLRLIPNGVETQRVFGSGVDLTHYRSRPLPSTPVFLMLSRLLFAKGVQEYAAAAASVRKTHPAARFLLAGAPVADSSGIGPEEVAAWEAGGPIEYLGSLGDVRPLLEGCRFLVLPSYYREGVPRSLLEGLATGRPIITTDVVGCRETVKPGVNGLLVPPRDAPALARAMTTLLDSPQTEVEAMAAASLKLAADRFDVRKVNVEVIRAMDL